MSAYLDSLTPTQLANIQTIVKALKARGIFNPVSIAGILAVVSKESGFIPQQEASYRGTSTARIRQIFPQTMKKLTDAQIDVLKRNDFKFFNFIYGGRYGNKADEGYKYRGASLNQLTFKDNFKKVGDLIGIDLVTYPEKANEIDVAGMILAEYFKKRFRDSATIVNARYGADSINDFVSTMVSAQAFYNANAGFGKDTRGSKMDGYKRALERVDDLYGLIAF